jgi:hypothetical protein
VCQFCHQPPALWNSIFQTHSSFYILEYILLSTQSVSIWLILRGYRVPIKRQLLSKQMQLYFKDSNPRRTVKMPKLIATRTNIVYRKFIWNACLGLIQQALWESLIHIKSNFQGITLAQDCDKIKVIVSILDISLSHSLKSMYSKCGYSPKSSVIFPVRLFYSSLTLVRLEQFFKLFVIGPVNWLFLAENCCNIPPTQMLWGKWPMKLLSPNWIFSNF